MLTLFPEYEIRNTDKNKLDQSDRRFHDWFRFVLSYPPHLVRQYVKEFDLKENDTVLDPFCGTGTTIVESKILGLEAIGVEANPSVHFASSVKTNWNTSGTALLQVAQNVKDSAIQILKTQGISDSPISVNMEVDLLLKLDAEKEKIILQNSISPLPLHKSLVLLNCINQYKDTEYHKYLLLALANIIVYQVSNLKFGPEVGVGKIKQDVAVIAIWFKQIAKMCRDLDSIDGTLSARSAVILSDARNLSEKLNGQKISAVITSPPYPNEKDYTRTTRLESVLLGFINSNEELKNLKKTLLRSNTRGVYKGDDDDKYVNGISSIQKIAAEIENRRIELGKTSGFEKMYSRVTKLYFGGMAKHLIDLQSVLLPGAHLAYVVGDQASYLRVMIRTGHLLAEIAQNLGYEVIRIDLFRTRFSTATKSDLNEEVVVLRWPG